MIEISSLGFSRFLMKVAKEKFDVRSEYTAKIDILRSKEFPSTGYHRQEYSPCLSNV